MTTCVIKLMSFMAGTVPPAFTLPVLATFDDHVESTFLHLLAPTGFECSQERMARATVKLRLPSPHGCGLFKTSDQGCIAWWASVTSCMTDPLLFRLRSGLDAFAADAWTYAVDALGGDTSKYWTQAKQFFPACSRGLLDGSMYSPAHPPSRTKLGKVFLRLCTRRELSSTDQCVSVICHTLQS